MTAKTQGAADVVVFDFGGVLLDWDPRHLYQGVIADPERREWFLAQVCTPDWNREQDRGRDWAQAVDQLARRFPEWRAEIEAFDLRWEEMIAGPIAGAVALLERLDEAGAPLYGITNFSSPKLALTFARFPFFARLRGVVVSGDERLLKPDPRIYATLFERYGLEPGRCLFIDDLAHNVEAARAVGMDATRFVDPETLAADLRARGFPA